MALLFLETMPDGGWTAGTTESTLLHEGEKQADL
jgi:hypothetical protein